MDDGANRKLCDAMARRQFSVKAKVSTVVSFGDRSATTYNDTCRNCVYIPGDSIPYTDHQRPGGRRVPGRLRQYQPGKELHQWALEAWVQGQMVAEGVAKMGPAPTRKGLEDYLKRPRQLHRQRRVHRSRLRARPTWPELDRRGLLHRRPLAGQQGRLGPSHRQVPLLLRRRQAVQLPRPGTRQLSPPHPQFLS